MVHCVFLESFTETPIRVTLNRCYGRTRHGWTDKGRTDRWPQSRPENI